MKKILSILIITLFFISCKKDKIYPRDRKNDCKDCIIVGYNDAGVKLGEITYDDYQKYLSDNNCNNCGAWTWCEYLDNKGNLNSISDLNGQSMGKPSIKCR